LVTIAASAELLRSKFLSPSTNLSAFILIAPYPLAPK
jgi:hypothetical protein